MARIVAFAKEVKIKLDKLDEKVFGILHSVFYGSGEDIIKPKKTKQLLIDFLNWLDYVFFSLLDRIDTRFIFKDRSVRTQKGRVRSRAERKLTRFFENHHIKYVYEPILVLDSVKLHPDFYLPEYNVYVEFWGLVDISEKYRRTMSAKKKLYKEHNISVISVYPRQLSDIEKNFPILFEKVVGKKFPA